MLEQVWINGYAYGGLSQVPESEYGSCSLANEIAIQVGAFGHTPSQLKEMLVDRMPEIAAEIKPYTRTLVGMCIATATRIEALFQVCFRNLF